MRSALTGKPVGVSSGGMGHEYTYLPQTSLWFTDDNTIAMTIVTGAPRTAPNPTLSQENEPNESWPLRLDAVFLDATSGKVKAVANWPASSTYSRMIAVHDGKFVTQRGTLLSLYSSDAKELKRLRLPVTPDGVSAGDWDAHDSPFGRSILFTTGSLMAASLKPWIWVDVDTLQTVWSWEEEQSGPVAISDNAIAMTACMSPVYHCGLNLEVRGLATGWKSIAQIDRSGWGFDPYFVDENTLYLPGESGKLLETDGRVIQTYQDVKGGIPITSAGGRRFVIPFFKVVGSHPALDIGGHGELTAILVYDAPFHERSYKLEVRGVKIRSFSDKSICKVALSPDGSKLAFLLDEKVYLFALPPPRSTPQLQIEN